MAPRISLGRLALTALLSVLALVLQSAAAAGMSSSSAFNPLANPLLATEPPASQQAILTSVLSTNASLDSCKPTGQISDARCDYESIELDINSSNFFPILDTLRREAFFRLYKVDLYRECPFWHEESLCANPDCAVAEVDEKDIPDEYGAATLSRVTTKPDDDVDLRSQSPASPHRHEHDASQSPADDTCQCAETDFCHWEDEDWSPESSWVDLIENPERFTGYSGTSAHNVWRSIYEENCFGVARPSGASSATQAQNYKHKPATEHDASKAAEALSSLLSGRTKAIDLSSSEAEQCLEKRVFYKLISGLHASISIHICHDYLDQTTGKWAPNLSCFVERIAQHPERLQNMYFTHAVLIRSLGKLGERLGLQAGESWKRAVAHADLMQNLAPGLPPATSATTISLASLLQQAVNTPPTFDEASMFDSSNPESDFLRTEFRDRFRNVSRIMDCVGCNKCRLWGKLQTNGLGTALKILFEGNQLTPHRLLQRSELVAIINTIHRVSESIRAVEAFRNLYQDEVARHEKEKETKNLKAPPVKQDKVEPDKASSRVGSIAATSRPKSAPPASDSSSTSALSRLLSLLRSRVDTGFEACSNQWCRCLAWAASLYETLGFSSSPLRAGSQHREGHGTKRDEL